MTSDGWIPEPYYDEVVPEPKATPTAWIGSMDDGAPGLLGFYDEVPERMLKDGDRVDFYETRSLGSATLTIAEDGSWSVDHEMPSGANLVCCPDTEDSQETIAELVRVGMENADEMWGGGVEPGSEHFITYWYWSERTRFRFDATSRSFVQVAA